MPEREFYATVRESLHESSSVLQLQAIAKVAYYASPYEQMLLTSRLTSGEIGCTFARPDL